jgi:hypothetical protein
MYRSASSKSKYKEGEIRKLLLQTRHLWESKALKYNRTKKKKIDHEMEKEETQDLTQGELNHLRRKERPGWGCGIADCGLSANQLSPAIHARAVSGFTVYGMV